MIYETIPTVVTDTLRTLYDFSVLNLRAKTPAAVVNVWPHSEQVADIRIVLTQISFVLSVVLVAFIVYVVVQKRALKAAAPAEPSVAVQSESQSAQSHTGIFRERWEVIMRNLDSTHEAQWKIAVIEADKLIDEALTHAGFPGATFGDRLSNIQPGTLLSLDGLWWAHKIRNRIAHETDFFLRYTEARQALGYFEAALAELQLI